MNINVQGQISKVQLLSITLKRIKLELWNKYLHIIEGLRTMIREGYQHSQVQNF